MSNQAGRLSPLLTQSSRVTAARAEGCYIFNDDGERYLDFTSGIGVTNAGHCHPHVVEAIRRQAGELIHGQYAIVKHPGMLELAERLTELMPAGLDSFFFVNAGCEAVEAALRLSRQVTGRPNIIAFQGGFHGRTHGALSLSSSANAFRAQVSPLMGGAVIAPFPDGYRYGWDEETATDFCLRELDHLLQTQSHPQETAAMIVEPVQGDGGYLPATRRFLQGLRERCDRHGILLIIDEVQSGNGRTGRFWGHQHFDVRPDLLVTAKGLASGMPLSVLAAPHSLMERGLPGSQGGTYGGNAVACAAALATLEVIEQEGLVERAAAQGRYLRERLEELAARYSGIGHVRGLGLMQGTLVVDAEGRPDGKRAARLVAHCEEQGVLLCRCGAYGGQVVRWLPPLIVEREQIDTAVGAFAAALHAEQRKAA